jgi:arylsulfatase A-like enzyme
VARGRVIDAPARQIDVLPTILEAAGAPLPPGLPGRSLLALAAGPREAHDPGGTFAYLDRGGRIVEAVVEDGRKLIRFRVEGRGAPRIGLFDLAADPGEVRDLAEQQPVWRDYLLARLDAAAAAAPDGPAPPTATLDPEQRRALEALGYAEE